MVDSVPDYKFMDLIASVNAITFIILNNHDEIQTEYQ